MGWGRLHSSGVGGQLIPHSRSRRARMRTFATLYCKQNFLSHNQSKLYGLLTEGGVSSNPESLHRSVHRPRMALPRKACASLLMRDLLVNLNAGCENDSFQGG